MKHWFYAWCSYAALMISPALALADETVPLYAGQKAGTYQAIGQDMVSLLSLKEIDVKIEKTDGSIDNIKHVAASKKAALGLVQADVLGFMRRSNNPETKKYAEQIRMVLPLYEEEVHVFARKDIKDFKSLKGKRVVVGEEGSGNMLTSVNLLALSNIRVGETIRLDPAEGVLAVLEDKADAVIFVGGKPVKLFKNIENLDTEEGKKFAPLLDQVHLIPVSSPEILAEYASSSITSDDYRFVTETIPTVSVQAVLVTGNYTDKKHSEACKNIAVIAETIKSKLPQLKKNGHPKWKQVDFNKSISLWEKDPCSWGKKVNSGL